jgi:hypothetical protein
MVPFTIGALGFQTAGADFAVEAAEGAFVEETALVVGASLGAGAQLQPSTDRHTPITMHCNKYCAR